MPPCLYLESSPGVTRPLLPPRAIVPLPSAPPLTRARGAVTVLLPPTSWCRNNSWT